MSVSTTRDPTSRSPSSPPETRRDDILEAALEVMSRRGFDRASITAIAGRAGMARATVYQHFCDKQDILVALADRIATRFIHAIDAWAPLPPDPGAGPDELRRLIDSRVVSALTAIAANADATRLVVRLTRGTDRVFVHDMLRRIDDHVVAVLSREIDAAVGFRWARPCDARTAARFILGGLDKIAMDAIDRDEPVRLASAAMAHEIGAFVFAALAHPELVTRGGPR